MGKFSNLIGPDWNIRRTEASLKWHIVLPVKWKPSKKINKKKMLYCSRLVPFDQFVAKCLILTRSCHIDMGSGTWLRTLPSQCTWSSVLFSVTIHVDKLERQTKKKNMNHPPIIDIFTCLYAWLSMLQHLHRFCVNSKLLLSNHIVLDNKKKKKNAWDHPIAC